MSARRVNNQVRLAGQIAYIRFYDKIATIVVNTGLSDDGVHSNYPKAIVFDKILNVAHKFQVGDYVLIDATMQGNKANTNLPPRTIAVNHIVKLDPESPKYHTANSFNFWGRIVNSKKTDDGKVKATIAIYTGQPNYITVYFESDNKDKIDEFCSLTKDNYVHLSGQIRTNRVLTDEDNIEFFDKLIIKDFRIVR